MTAAAHSALTERRRERVMSVNEPLPRTEDLASTETRKSLAPIASTVHYWVYEPVEPLPARVETVPTIVIVHGFRGDHHGLERVVELLPWARIVAPDLPGFGLSDAFSQAEHSVQNYVTFLDRFCRLIEIPDSAILLGHSFGSIVASHFVAAHPRRFQALILINPIADPALSGTNVVGSRLAQFYYWLSAKLPQTLGQTLLSHRAIVRVMSVLMAQSKDPALRRFVHDQHDKYFSRYANRRSLLEAFSASISNYVGQVARELPGPTLLIAGAKDSIAPKASQVRLFNSLNDAQLHVIGDVGHLIHYETPVEAAEAITTFISDQTGKANKD